jgi:hypothetical protein
MLERKFAFCRPLKGYFCTECCKHEGLLCPMLSPLPDGTEGCLSYYNKTQGDISKIQACDDFVCLPELALLNEYTEKTLEAVREELSKRPRGKFNLREILDAIDYPSLKPKKTKNEKSLLTRIKLFANINRAH